MTTLRGADNVVGLSLFDDESKDDVCADTVTVAALAGTCTLTACLRFFLSFFLLLLLLLLQAKLTL
jgi:hypothetical protein